MAIQITNLLINTQEFVLKGRKLKATYTPEIDKQFSNLMIDINELEKKMTSKQADELNVEAKKKLSNESSEKASRLATDYIKALFSPEDAKFILEATGGRDYNLGRLAGIFFKAGNDDEVENNRQERRQNNKKGK
ncbi:MULTISPECIES: hypothetical protein [Convivina]|uniref:Uncharacterized protein n=1 Tax=Convivina intestini TaxID=1505726 RepID=A0A2U1DG21_9LACO|nr:MULTISPECIES: hypothetical protein [Convivina]PVY86509.1 hypothetical protein C7384_101429 [Convivina intestini]CAH1853326.1 hypothetical protein R077815_00799 [Convivina sp. LMG 32447]CAH1857467.1 hypothetical protein R077811_01519 [Convivina intestini]SDC12944.1 hypothetical protein SAMN05216341_11414 [Leuconostocaceae bacterium R-53105]